MKWFDCKKKMPPTDKRGDYSKDYIVNCVAPRGNKFVRVATFEYPGVWKYWIGVNDHLLETGGVKVTHWMRMPKPKE